MEFHSFHFMISQVRQLDVPTSKQSIVGRHSGEPSKIACSCLKKLQSSDNMEETDGEGHVLVSAGWHSQLHVWDIRTSAAVATLDLPGKAFSMDVYRNRILVATSAGRRLVLVDYRYGKAKLLLDRESSLKYQTRTVQFFPNGQGYALGSIEGRVAVEYIPPELLTDATTTTTIHHSALGKKNYAFKCHRIQDTVYPVNAIAFCPTQDCSFATGGCDGTVVLWDGLHKKKLTCLPRMATSIAALAFTPNGKQLAIAASYTFEEGEKDHPRDDIFVRTILDSEVQPKATP
jgi:cell cycle arrest protein BUB3